MHVAGVGVAQGVVCGDAPGQASVAAGAGGRSRILKSGWTAVKWIGTSGPSCPATHPGHRVQVGVGVVEAGISRLVISSHTLVSCLRYGRASSTRDPRA